MTTFMTTLSLIQTVIYLGVTLALAYLLRWRAARWMAGITALQVIYVIAKIWFHPPFWLMLGLNIAMVAMIGLLIISSVRAVRDLRGQTAAERRRREAGYTPWEI